MKRKLSILLLILVLMMALTGCCFHKEWADATCEAPRTCLGCGETEGEALGHIWVDATTEAPKTCTRCSGTDGERIITDPRFTTAATIDFHGTWKGTSTISGNIVAEGLDATMPVEMTLVLGNDSSMQIDIIGHDTDAFLESARQFLHAQLEAEINALGLELFSFAEAMDLIYGVTAEEYVNTQLEALDLSALTQGHTITGVYYVEGDQFYAGLGWDADLNSFPFQLNGDTLVVQGDLSGLGQGDSQLTRVSE